MTSNSHAERSPSASCTYSGENTVSSIQQSETTLAYIGRGWGDGRISGHVSMRWVGHCTKQEQTVTVLHNKLETIYSLLAMVVSTFGHLLPACGNTTESGIILGVHTN
jgi:hypothetical protein